MPGEDFFAVVFIHFHFCHKLVFSDCVFDDDDLDPDCDNRKIALDAQSFILSGGNFVGLTSGLAGVAFNAGEDLDFLTDLEDSDTMDVSLVVPIDVFSGQIPTPKQSTRTINYGTRFECGSDPVTVTRLDEGCWEVESFPDNVACLILDTGHGSKAAFELQGRYNMPFLMTLRTFSGLNEGNMPMELASCGNP